MLMQLYQPVRHYFKVFCNGLMGLLSILKKEKQKRRELRLLFV